MSKTNRSYINNQAVAVLNQIEYDSNGNPIGMKEDPTNPLSSNFGIDRAIRRGGCYKGNGSLYITVPELLTTDTIQVHENSGLPTCITNGKLDIVNGIFIYGVSIYRNDVLWAFYKCDENSGSICYDSSGNGNHGTIVNAITTTPEENPNSIHQYQNVKSYHNDEGYNKSDSVFIPKDQSITVPPFKDVLGNNLQYFGKVPARAGLKESSCFKGDGNAYMTGDVLTTDTITAHPESEVPVCTVDGRIDFPILDGNYFGIKIERNGILHAYLPLCEPIKDPSNHIYYDIS